MLAGKEETAEWAAAVVMGVMVVKVAQEAQEEKLKHIHPEYKAATEAKAEEVDTEGKAVMEGLEVALQVAVHG